MADGKGESLIGITSELTLLSERLSEIGHEEIDRELASSYRIIASTLMECAVILNITAGQEVNEGVAVSFRVESLRLAADRRPYRPMTIEGYG